MIAVREALSRFSATERAVLVLVDLEGRSMAEAAEALGTTNVGTRGDVSRLVVRVPALMREAARRRAEPPDRFAWMLPRLAVATAAAVVVAAALVLWDRSATTGTAFESLILGNETSTGDVLLDALLGSERDDG